ncbi:MAG: hypothetical protein AB8B85_21830 [Paracoccaceae bacterium]
MFTAEYGEALRERMVLDNATHDVARFLARSAIDDTGLNPAPVVPVFYQATLDEAQEMFDNRVGFGESGSTRFSGGQSVIFNTTITPGDQINFREDYLIIQVRATTYVDLPLLSLINAFSESSDDSDNIISDGETSTNTPNPLRLFLTAETQVRWLGGAEPGSADCSLANRYLGICP